MSGQVLGLYQFNCLLEVDFVTLVTFFGAFISALLGFKNDIRHL